MVGLPADVQANLVVFGKYQRLNVTEGIGAVALYAGTVRLSMLFVAITASPFKKCDKQSKGCFSASPCATAIPKAQD